MPTKMQLFEGKSLMKRMRNWKRTCRSEITSYIVNSIASEITVDMDMVEEDVAAAVVTVEEEMEARQAANEILLLIDVARGEDVEK